jgi:hypothetical protein
MFRPGLPLGAAWRCCLDGRLAVPLGRARQVRALLVLCNGCEKKRKIMKTCNPIKIRWLFSLLATAALFCPFRGFAQDDTNDFSWLKLIPPGDCLDSWSFEDTNTWDSD